MQDVLEGRLQGSRVADRPSANINLVKMPLILCGPEEFLMVWYHVGVVVVDGKGEGGAGGARVEVGGAVVRVERVERWVRWRKPVVEIGSFFVREGLIGLILHRNHWQLENLEPTLQHMLRSCWYALIKQGG